VDLRGMMPWISANQLVDKSKKDPRSWLMREHPVLDVQENGSGTHEGRSENSGLFQLRGPNA
jgi:hypothetical protein